MEAGLSDPSAVESRTCRGHPGPATGIAPCQRRTRAGEHEQRTTSMTALQDWLSIRPVDQSAIREMVCRPLRAVLSTSSTTRRPEFRLQTPGIERC
jgi:hypothetical protein